MMRIIHKPLRVYFFLRQGWNKLRGNALSLKDTFITFHEQLWINAAEAVSAEFEKFDNGFYRIRKNEKTTWIKDYLVNLDSFASLKLARNKPLVASILQQNGATVPDFLVFTPAEIDKAKAFLKTSTGSCVVKPALESAGGTGVTMNVKTHTELIKAALFAAAFCPQVIIEEQVSGDVYRFLYLDGKLIDAVLRHPPILIGDGRSTIQQLIQAENRKRVEQGGIHSLKVLVTDQDCRNTLKTSGYSFRSVPAKGVAVRVKSTTNDSSSSESMSVLNKIAPVLADEVADAIAPLELRLAGVDVVTPDIGKSLTESGGAIIEVNACPGLQYHYQISNKEEGVDVAVEILKTLLADENKTDIV